MPNHTVKDGDGLDSLWKIAKHHGVSFQELKGLNAQLKDRVPSYWIEPGDVLKLPTCIETGDIKKVSQPCPKKKKVLAIKGPTRFRLCKPAIFKVSEYQGDPTEADKQFLIAWFIRDAVTHDDLLKANASSIRLDGERLEIDCVPFDWHGRTIEVGADFFILPPYPLFVGKPGSCELYDWIALIQRAEAAYPSMSGVEMTDSMRDLANYDTELFQKLYSSKKATALAPAGPFTAADSKQATDWTSHGMKGGIEVGIVEDPLGSLVAAGHVLTGLSGGVYRDSNADVTPWYAIGAGDTVDNLYAATISGDLGQTAVLAMVKASGRKLAPARGTASPGPYIGTGTDATDAELIGDIDGWLIGLAEPKGGSGKKLSETLLSYYCPCKNTGVNCAKRFKSFSAKVKLAKLTDEVEWFANTYAYGKMDKDAANAADFAPNSALSVSEFMVWLSTMVLGEK